MRLLYLALDLSPFSLILSKVTWIFDKCVILKGVRSISIFSTLSAMYSLPFFRLLNMCSFQKIAIYAVLCLTLHFLYVSVRRRSVLRSIRSIILLLSSSSIKNSVILITTKIFLRLIDLISFFSLSCCR